MNLVIERIADGDFNAAVMIDRASSQIHDGLWGLIRFTEAAGNVGVVARCDGVVVGAMYFSLWKAWIEVHAVEVLPDCRRQGIGTALLRFLMGPLSGFQMYEQIVTAVRLSDRDGFGFLTACGFSVEDVYHGYFEGPGGGRREDGFAFSYLREFGAVGVHVETKKVPMASARHEPNADLRRL